MSRMGAEQRAKSTLVCRAEPRGKERKGTGWVAGLSSGGKERNRLGCRAELQGKPAGLTLLWCWDEPWVRMSRLALQEFRVEHFGCKAEPFIESQPESLGVQG